VLQASTARALNVAASISLTREDSNRIIYPTVARADLSVTYLMRISNSETEQMYNVLFYLIDYVDLCRFIC